MKSVPSVFAEEFFPNCCKFPLFQEDPPAVQRLDELDEEPAEVDKSVVESHGQSGGQNVFLCRAVPHC